MPSTHRFLDWNQPLLPQAVDYLIDRFGSGDRVDMERVLIAVPGAAAGHQLLALLVIASEQQQLPLSPPRIMTLGAVPEELYVSQLPFATPMVQKLAWIDALKKLNARELNRLVADPPPWDNQAFWWEVGELLARLNRELAGDALSFSDVTKTGESMDGFPESDRWKILEKLQQSYFHRLDELELWDRQSARRVAIQHGAQEIKTDQTIVLIGTVDMNRAMRSMLACVSPQIEILTYANPDWDESERSRRFDELGCLKPQAWQTLPVPIEDSQFEVVDRPADQAQAVRDWLVSLGDDYAVDEVAVTLADSQLLAPIERTLSEAGQPSRWQGGLGIEETAPIRLITAIATYLERQRFVDLAALVRHPDFYSWLVDRGMPVNYLEALDEFQQRDLPLLFTARKSSKAEVNTDDDASLYAVIQRLRQQLEQVLAPLQDSDGHWTNVWNAWRTLLDEIYGDRTIDRSNPSQRLQWETAEHINSVIMRCLEVPESLAGSLTPGAAARILLDELAGVTLGLPRQEQDLDLIGWLDVPWDSSTAAIVAGFNEGNIPSTESTDLFLPDPLRERLGVLDNTRRLARDTYALSLLANSKRQFRVISGRRSGDGDPLIPSRLLFQVPADQVATRTIDVFRELGEESPFAEPYVSGAEEAFPARTHSEADGPKRIVVPAPQLHLPPLSELSVTRFRDYLQCPYRFYLSNVLRLSSLDDSAREIDAGSFGELLHHIFDLFATSPQRDSTDADEIRHALHQIADGALKSRFAKPSLPTVPVQLEQLRARLNDFAQAQAEHARQGWRIESTEIDARADDFVVDDQPFVIKGRIDRVDRNIDNGDLLLLDYKTSDTAIPAEKRHRSKGEWVDLQLPLYRHLPLAANPDGQPIQLGIFHVARDASQTRVETATWSESELSEADEVARAVVRGLRERRFWPPADVQLPWPDPLDAICQVDVFQPHWEQTNGENSA